MVRPQGSHPTPAPNRDVGATLAVARHSWHSDENKSFKTQIMLPFQGENGLPFFLTQGDAIGLRYAALSGRKWIGVFNALKGQYSPAQRQRLGRKRIGVFYALKGQYNPAQRQRLGLFENKGFTKTRSYEERRNHLKICNIQKT